MQVIRRERAAADEADAYFEGKARLVRYNESVGGYLVSLVRFEAGAHTKWHSHPRGQVLYVVSGTGFVQEKRGGRRRLSGGDVVIAEPWETHRHGAAASSPLAHVSVTQESAHWDE